MNVLRYKPPQKPCTIYTAFAVVYTLKRTKIAPLLVCWKPPNRQGSALALPPGSALTFDEYRERKVQERRSRFGRLRNRGKRRVRRLMKSRFRSAWYDWKMENWRWFVDQVSQNQGMPNTAIARSASRAIHRRTGRGGRGGLQLPQFWKFSGKMLMIRAKALGINYL